MKTITNIRKAVATLANKLNNKIKNLSNSFCRAWQMVKAQLLLQSKVAGVTFGNRQKALARLARYNPKLINVELVREVNNQYDSNAIGVHVSVNGSRTYQIGYLPKESAELMAKLIDNGIELKTAFKGVTGGTVDKFNYGALIEIEI